MSDASESKEDGRRKLKHDLTGRRCGRWTVIERTACPSPDIRKKSVWWKCRCDCGTVRAVRSLNLVKGFSKSCGCDLPLKSHLCVICGAGFEGVKNKTVCSDKCRKIKHARFLREYRRHLKESNLEKLKEKYLRDKERINSDPGALLNRRERRKKLLALKKSDPVWYENYLKKKKMFHLEHYKKNQSQIREQQRILYEAKINSFTMEELEQYYESKRLYVSEYRRKKELNKLLKTAATVEQRMEEQNHD